MGAAIVLGDHLDILITVASVQFVLDAEIGEVDAVVEVRQVVFVRPTFDLARIAIGSSIAIRSAAISFLETLLVLAFERVVQDDATDLRALVARRSSSATTRNAPMAARQFEAFEEHVARIEVSLTRVAIAVTNVVTVARIVLFAIKSRPYSSVPVRHTPARKRV